MKSISFVAGTLSFLVVLSVSTTGEARGDRGVASFTIECATVSSGAGIVDNDSLLVVGQPVAGTISNASYTIEVGVVPCLAAASAPSGCPNTCGDINGSGGNIDLVDFASFAVCFGGPAGVSQACNCSDLNADGNINLLDFATFTLLFNGVSTNSPPNCP